MSAFTRDGGGGMEWKGKQRVGMGAASVGPGSGVGPQTKPEDVREAREGGGKRHEEMRAL